MMIPTRKGVMAILLLAVIVLAWPMVWIAVPAGIVLGGIIADPTPWGRS